MEAATEALLESWEEYPVDLIQIEASLHTEEVEEY